MTQPLQPFSFEAVFKSAPQEPKADDKKEKEETLEEEPKIEATGPSAPLKHENLEPDENIVFKQRAKLFRFDAENKQWKERGTGEVKLLQHKTTKKIRLLMRREKTLKLKENVGSDRSWIWACMDYSDETPKQETLAIRFVNSEQAKAFKAKFEEAQAEMERVMKGGPEAALGMAVVDDKKEEEEKKPEEKKAEEKPEEKKPEEAAASAVPEQK